MIPGETTCGTCGGGVLVKEFRQARIRVCQTCRTVTLDKADFKRLLQTSTPQPAASRPSPVMRPDPIPVSTGSSPSMDLGDVSRAASAHDGPALTFAEDTEELPGGPAVGTSAPTEIGGYEPAFVESGTAFGDRPAYSPEPAGLDEVPYVADYDEVDDETFEAELTAYAARRRRTMLVAGAGIVGVAALLGILVVGAGVAGFFVSETTSALEPTSIAAAPTPEPAPRAEPRPAEPEPAEPEPVEPAPEPVAPAPAEPRPAEPTPAAPVPVPSEPAATGASPEVHARRGWNVFDRSPAEAAEHFQAALALSPSHADANYGYGYALVKLGRNGEATPYLCRASRSGDAEIARDIRALLRRNGLTCE